MEIQRPSSAPNFGPPSSPRRSEAYAPSLDSAERQQATFLEDIERQAGMRNRQIHGQPELPRDEQDASSTDSNATLTPSSNSDHEETGSTRLRFSDRVRHLLARLPRRPFSGTANKDLRDKELGYDDIKSEKLDDFVKGIPRLAKLQDSDDSFRVVRRFGTPTFRILLRKQIEIHKLVNELYGLDATDDATDSLRYRVHSVHELEGSGFEKSKLMDKLERQMTTYYDFLLKYSDVQALTDVPARDHRSVQNWMVWNKPLLKGEDDFFKIRDDLAFAKTKRSSGGQYSNMIEDLIESCRARFPNSWFNALFRDPKVDENGAATVDYTAPKIRLVLSNAVVALSAITIVLVPVFLMFLINVDRQAMAAIVTGFVFIFMVLISPIVNVGAHELFLCVAGYSAVLVAILGSKMSQGNSCPSN